MTFIPHECKIEANFTSETPEDLLIQKLKKTYLGDNGFDEAFEHPRKYYANQPGWIVGFLIFFRTIFFIAITIIITNINILIVAINVVIITINVIITIVNVLSLGTADIEKLDTIKTIKLDDIFSPIDNVITGAGRYAICPLVREIYGHHCAAYGLTFQSSIFNDPNSQYYNFGLFLLQNDKGIEEDDNENWQYNNEPAENIMRLLDILATAFNAEWLLIENTLIFERKDWFIKNLEVRFNAQIDSESTGYSHDGSKLYGSWRGEYRRDSLDDMGNGMLNYGYADDVEWNDPPSENQKGQKEVYLELGAVRHSFDRVSAVDSGKFINLSFQIDMFRSGKGPLNFAIFPGFPGLRKNFGTTREDMLIIGNHTCQHLKGLCFVKNLNRKDAKLIKRPAFPTPLVVAEYGAVEFFDYNYPMYFDEFYPEKELYQNFHHIDNPRLNLNNRIISGTIEFELDCNLVLDLTKRAPLIGIQTPFGIAKAENYVIDFNNCKITAQNIEILCNFGQ
jgi:hypothetical protein